MSLRQEGRRPDVADLAELCPALDAAVRAGPPRLAPHLVGEELGQVRDVGGVLHQHLRKISQCGRKTCVIAQALASPAADTRSGIRSCGEDASPRP